MSLPTVPLPLQTRLNTTDDFWEFQAPLIIIPCNGTLSANYRLLVMGAGAAKEAAFRFPGIEEAAAKNILDVASHSDQTPEIIRGAPVYLYGFLIVLLTTHHGQNRMIGLFQSKRHWKDPSSLALLGYSMTVLNRALKRFTQRRPIPMLVPGVGLGGLKREEVYPLLREADSRIVFYDRDNPTFIGEQPHGSRLRTAAQSPQGNRRRSRP